MHPHASRAGSPPCRPRAPRRRRWLTALICGVVPRCPNTKILANAGDRERQQRHDPVTRQFFDFLSQSKGRQNTTPQAAPRHDSPVASGAAERSSGPTKATPGPAGIPVVVAAASATSPAAPTAAPAVALDLLAEVATAPLETDGRPGWLVVGARVEANWRGRVRWFAGKVAKVNQSGGRPGTSVKPGATYDILYDDGDREQRVKVRASI